MKNTALRSSSSEIVLAALLIASSAPSGAEGQLMSGGKGATCRPADNVTEMTVRAWQNVVTSTDTAAISFRQRQSIPSTSRDRVRHVTEDSTCAKLERAYSAELAYTGIKPSGSVYVFEVGDVYVVRDPAQRLGEFGIEMTISKALKVLAKRG